MTWRSIFCLLLSGAFLAAPLLAMAQMPKPILYLNGKPNNSYGNHKDTPQNALVSSFEPSLSPIQFYALEPPKTLMLRIEALAHGITMSLPPEYDYYGYELRRYMAAIAGPDVLGDVARLQVEIANTKRAAIVLQRWEEALNKEIRAIEAEIEEHDADTPARTRFKSNKAKIYSFTRDCKAWIEANDNMLQFLSDLRGEYEYRAPNFNFAEAEALATFAALYDTRDQALQRMHDYTPFRVMVY